MNFISRPPAILQVAFLWLSLFGFTLFSPTGAFASSVETIESYFTAINQGNYDAAAKLFKYLDYDTGEEYVDKVQEVAGDLRDLAADFGTVEILNQANAIEGSYTGHGVSAGPAEYLEKYPPQHFVHLQVTFSKIGRGYISFWFNSTGGVDNLVMVFYSVPKDQVQNTTT